jgi:uncharacterized protein
MTEGEPVSISALPALLHWQGVPQKWSLDSDNVLAISAGQRTDWFINPEGGKAVSNAPALLMPAQGVYMLQARVTVDCVATFDAGVLTVYHSDQVWAKLCLELSPQKQVTVVSVVTKGTSDDCNSVPIAGNSIYFRISRLARAYAFHYSSDGMRWNLVRHFTLGESQDAKIGFLTQSPTGEGCTARFSEIVYIPQKLSDIRSGI